MFPTAGRARRPPDDIRSRIRVRSALTLVAGCIVLGGCGADDGDGSRKINGSVHVVAGRAPADAETVNGGIDIDDNATVITADTVNGGIHLGAHASAEALRTVNGSITVGAGGRVAQRAESVNGGVSLHEGAEVLGAVANVNGRIEIDGAHVGGGIKTVNGSIAIRGPSRVEGGILVEKAGGQLIHFGSDVPRIEIGAGAVVQGNLRFEREVKLYVSDKATIGPVTGATPVTFSGNSPPAG